MSEWRFSEDCAICPIVQGPDEAEQDRRLIEGQYWAATLREDQQFLGTTFVTLYDHKQSLLELTPAEETEFISIRNRLIRTQERVLGAAVVNISCLMNEAFRDSQPTPHVHYHFKPRYKEPVIINGEMFEDPEFGSYIREKQPHLPAQKTLEHIAMMMRAGL